MMTELQVGLGLFAGGVIWGFSAERAIPGNEIIRPFHEKLLSLFGVITGGAIIGAVAGYKNAGVEGAFLGAGIGALGGLASGYVIDYIVHLKPRLDTRVLDTRVLDI